MWGLSIGIFLVLSACCAAYRLRWLGPSGSIAAGVLGTIVIVCGGIQWILPMLAFFIPSSFLSSIIERKKSSVSENFEKNSRRDAIQVFANGGGGGLLALSWFYVREDPIYLMYLGGLAAVSADTWATECGILSNTRPVLISTLQRVDSGTSGAISLAGTLGGFLGAVCVASSGMIWLPSSGVRTGIAVVLAGMTGCVFDSILGAIVQRRFRCTKCGRRVEKRIHCGQDTEWLGGIGWFNNDLVNLSCYLGGMLSVLAWNRMM